MTELEWLMCMDPMQMLRFIRKRVSKRKGDLFAVACCRRLWEVLGSQLQNVVRQIERNAEGEDEDVGGEELAELLSQAKRAAPGDFQSRLDALYAPLFLNWQTYDFEEFYQGMEQRGQVAIVRCLFASPFHPKKVESQWLAWNDGTIPKIAQAIYDERAFDRLPILADALEDAGCDDADILRHCREPSEHVRGCWVIDLLLRKE